MDAQPLTVDEAAEELDGLPLVPALSGGLAYIKEVRDKCLAAGIPALLAGPQPGRGWGTKAHLLVEEDEIPRVAQVLRGEWADMLAREGNAPVAACGLPAADSDDLPCPACGTVAPLVAGACTDCGLQLE